MAELEKARLRKKHAVARREPADIAAELRESEGSDYWQERHFAFPGRSEDVFDFAFDKGDAPLGWTRYPLDPRQSKLVRIREANIHRLGAKGYVYGETVLGGNDVRAELEELRQRVVRLEGILEGVDESGFRDPSIGWCEDHLEKLKEVGDSFVAIDVEKSEIVIAEKEQQDFIDKLKQLDVPRRKSLFTTHTSLYLKPSGN